MKLWHSKSAMIRTLIVLIAVMILLWVTINILKIFTYPDMRAVNRPKENEFSKAYCVKRARNKQSGINLGSIPISLRIVF
jgi:hypothetical protein